MWTDIGKYRSRDSQITFSVIHGWLAFGGPAMLTKMTEEDWVLVLAVFDACRSRRGDKGRDDRKFLEALHYFTVHNITWRGLPAEFGSWNSIWKRFWRLSRSGVCETFFEALASLSERISCRCSTRPSSARMCRWPAQKGAGRRSTRALPGRLLDQDPSQDRSRRLSDRLPSDRRRSERQPQLRSAPRPRPRC